MGPRPRPPVNAETRAAAAESRGGRNGRTGRRPPLVIAADARDPPEGHLSRRRRAHGLRRSRAAAGAALASLPWRGRSSGGALVPAAMTTRMGPSGCSADLVLMGRHATPVRHGRPKTPPLFFPFYWWRFSIRYFWWSWQECTCRRRPPAGPSGRSPAQTAPPSRHPPAARPVSTPISSPRALRRSGRPRECAAALYERRSLHRRTGGCVAQWGFGQG